MSSMVTRTRWRLQFRLSCAPSPGGSELVLLARFHPSRCPAVLTYGSLMCACGGLPRQLVMSKSRVWSAAFGPDGARVPMCTFVCGSARAHPLASVLIGTRRCLTGEHEPTSTNQRDRDNLCSNLPTGLPGFRLFGGSWRPGRCCPAQAYPP
jgi:hypothetical protein